MQTETSEENERIEDLSKECNAENTVDSQKDDSTLVDGSIHELSRRIWVGEFTSKHADLTGKPLLEWDDSTTNKLELKIDSRDQSEDINIPNKGQENLHGDQIEEYASNEIEKVIQFQADTILTDYITKLVHNGQSEKIKESIDTDNIYNLSLIHI